MNNKIKVVRTIKQHRGKECIEALIEYLNYPNLSSFQDEFGDYWLMIEQETYDQFSDGSWVGGYDNFDGLAQGFVAGWETKT